MLSFWPARAERRRGKRGRLDGNVQKSRRPPANGRFGFYRPALASILTSSQRTLMVNSAMAMGDAVEFRFA